MSTYMNCDLGVGEQLTSTSLCSELDPFGVCGFYTLRYSRRLPIHNQPFLHTCIVQK